MGSMNPAASPASSRPAVPGTRHSTASGPRHTGRVSIRRGGEPVGQLRLGGDGARNQRRRVAERRPIRGHDTHICEAIRQRRDTNVASGPHVHLPARRQAGHAGEIPADRPAPGRARVPRQPERTRQPRRAAVRSDDEPCAHLPRPATLLDRTPCHVPPGIRHDVLDPHTFDDGDAGAGGRLQEPMIEN